ncbi:DUF6093 family protein [Pseudarthrobacter sp. MEB009]|uniref:DUF6093 family protein n=1 Tax=Pseudarthrobacter sp. MEB009 TaxID=3040326 RepID=UPI002556418F|nr:DUF6093 family protein [Pseudarthrobacter sp. MEB009]
MPFHKTSVIPQGWAERHRPAVTGTMTVPCQLVRISEGPPPYPKPPGWTGERVIHDTMCRLQELKREGGANPGEQPTTLREYLVTVPHVSAEGVPLPELRSGERGDVVRVLGRRYAVTNMMFGSLEFSRELVCVDNQTQQNPE